MIQRFIHYLLWSRCDRHNISYNSDLCPQCNRARAVPSEEAFSEFTVREPDVSVSLHIRRLIEKGRA